jgi:hypothetical protein
MAKDYKMNRLEHLLVIMSEECAEVQQDIAKALRFGLDEGRDISGTNEQRIRKEFNQLIAMVEMLEKEGVDLSPDHAARLNKKQKVEKYLEYSKECGTLAI